MSGCAGRAELRRQLGDALLGAGQLAQQGSVVGQRAVVGARGLLAQLFLGRKQLRLQLDQLLGLRRGIAGVVDLVGGAELGQLALGLHHGLARCLGLRAVGWGTVS